MSSFFSRMMDYLFNDELSIIEETTQDYIQLSPRNVDVFKLEEEFDIDKIDFENISSDESEKEKKILKSYYDSVDDNLFNKILSSIPRSVRLKIIKIYEEDKKVLTHIKTSLINNYYDIISLLGADMSNVDFIVQTHEETEEVINIVKKRIGDIGITGLSGAFLTILASLIVYVIIKIHKHKKNKK